jgi:tetratricopeptide (TPR) repeat protein
VFEGIGAAVLVFLAQHAAGGAIDRVVGERIDAFRANGQKHKAFDRSVALALAKVEHDHPGHARILADQAFLQHHAVIELAKFFSARALPSAEGLVLRWRDYRTHVPAAAPAIAAAFIDAIRDALIEHPEFRELIWFKWDAADSERLRAVGDDVAALRRLLEVMQLRQAPKPRPVNQLPADLPDFQGREEQVVRLREILTKGGGQAAVTAIGGMGGVGKSALAVHVAHLLEKEAPDGWVFVDLGGRTGTRFAPVGAGAEGAPLTPVEAMVKVVAALDPEKQVAKEEDAARHAYRAALDGRRVLLLLDNAEDSAQVRPLLDWRAPTTMVVVTSRRAITAPGLQALDLDAMGAGEAKALLRTVLGARALAEEELERIAERGGRLPLALRVAGTYLAGNPQVKVDAYLEALADEKQRLRRLKIEDDASLDVYAALGLSARRLAEEKPALEARWRLLAVFPASFAGAAAAAVWETDSDDALRDLGELRQRSMVLWDAADDRWRLHDLMRDVAEVPLEGQDEAALAARLEAAQAQHARHYLRVLWQCDAFHKEKGRTVEGLALYDLEQRNIAAGQAWAAARIEQDDAAAELAAGYSDAGFYVLNLRLHPLEWIEWLEAQRKACVRLGDRRGEGNALGNLGIAWADLGKPRRAIEYCEQRLVIAREIGDRRGEGAALGNMGRAWADLAEPRQTIGYHEQHLAIARELGDRRGEGNALGNLGVAYRQLGEPLRAIDVLEQQPCKVCATGDRRGEGAALTNLGLAWADLDEAQRAIDYQERALKIFRSIGSRLGQEKSQGYLGNHWKRLGKPRRAIEYYETQLDSARSIGDRRGESTELGNIGVVWIELGESRRAIEYHEQSLTIVREIGDRMGRSRAVQFRARA